METKSIDIDRRKYPDWLRYGPERPKPIMIIEVPLNISAERLARIKEEFIGKGYHIVLRSEKVLRLEKVT